MTRDEAIKMLGTDTLRWVKIRERTTGEAKAQADGYIKAMEVAIGILGKITKL